MTDLQSRVRSGLGGDWDSTHSPWEGLMRLYEADREAFYLLACDGLNDGGDEVTRPMADLAREVRSAVRGTYRIEENATAVKPSSSVAPVRHFDSRSLGRDGEAIPAGN